jgi:hypothetical protein
MQEITPPPFQPENLDAMRARWAYALSPVYDFKKCISGEQTPPGLERKHLFDFEDGVRMIVSLENNLPTNEQVMSSLHISFGIHKDFQAAWIPKGSAHFADHCCLLLSMFQLGKYDDHQFTKKAFHVWYHNKYTQ